MISGKESRILLNLNQCTRDLEETQRLLDFANGLIQKGASKEFKAEIRRREGYLTQMRKGK